MAWSTHATHAHASISCYVREIGTSSRTRRQTQRQWIGWGRVDESRSTSEPLLLTQLLYHGMYIYIYIYMYM